MKMRGLAWFLAVGLFLGWAFPAPAADLAEVLARIKKKVTELKVQDPVHKTTAVGGVRGDEDRETADLYWAGKREVTKAELAAFEKAVSLAEKGQTAEARKALQAFLEAYPSSALSGEAEELLAALPAPEGGAGS